MPNLLATGAEWLGGQLQTHGGQSCTYFHGADSLAITLVQRRNHQPKDSQFTARLDEFTGLVSDLEISGDPFLPQPFDEIEWTDDNGEPQIAVVFPRPREADDGLGQQHCFRFPDPTKKLIRIYTVAQDSLESVSITSDGNTFNARGIAGMLRGQELFDRYTSRLLTTSLYLLRSEFEARGISTPPMMASVDVLGLEDWSVRMEDVEWGEVLVKLGIQRETLIREFQARRNAAI